MKTKSDQWRTHWTENCFLESFWTSDVKDKSGKHLNQITLFTFYAYWNELLSRIPWFSPSPHELWLGARSGFKSTPNAHCLHWPTPPNRAFSACLRHSRRPGDGPGLPQHIQIVIQIVDSESDELDTQVWAGAGAKVMWASPQPHPPSHLEMTRIWTLAKQLILLTPRGAFPGLWKIRLLPLVKLAFV